MPRIRYKEAASIDVLRGRPTIGQKPTKKILLKVYCLESNSIREVAAIIGCTKDMVYRSLKQYGVKSRPGFARSRLRKYSLADLEKGIKEKGFKMCAEELGIHENTLRYFLKQKKAKK